jgi:hypothetical protein
LRNLHSMYIPSNLRHTYVIGAAVQDYKSIFTFILFENVDTLKIYVRFVVHVWNPATVYIHICDCMYLSM